MRETGGDVTILRYKGKNYGKAVHRFRTNFGVDGIIKTIGKDISKDDCQRNEGEMFGKRNLEKCLATNKENDGRFLNKGDEDAKLNGGNHQR